MDICRHRTPQIESGSREHVVPEGCCQMRILATDAIEDGSIVLIQLGGKELERRYNTKEGQMRSEGREVTQDAPSTNPASRWKAGLDTRERTTCWFRGDWATLLTR